MLSGLSIKGITSQQQQALGLRSPPIDRVPTEILAQIFIWMVTHDFFTNSITVLSFAFTSEAVKVSQVCRFWREVALNTPKLWTQIYICPGNDTATFVRVSTYLSRSKRSPLKVWTRMSSWSALKAFRLLLPHFHRLQWLYIDIETVTSQQNPFGITSDPLGFSGEKALVAPSLESLHVKRSYWSPKLDLFFHTCAAPALRTLDIYATNGMNWDEDILPQSLSHLSVRSTPTLMTLYDFPGMLRTLRSMACLTHLSLSTALPPISELATVLPIVATTISLTKLQVLKLTDRMLSCAQFLQHCTVPPSAETTLCFTDLCQKEQLTLLASELSSFFSTRDETLSYEFHANMQHLSFAFYQLPAKSRHAGSDFTVVIPKLNGIKTVFPIWQIYCHFPLQNVTDMTVYYLPREGKAMAIGWFRMLMLLKNLETLHICRADNAADVGRLLLMTTGSTSSSAVERAALPKLKFLRLRCITINTSLVKSLSIALERRKMVGPQYALKRISLLDCIDVQDRDVNILRNFVEVNWDGQRLLN